MKKTLTILTALLLAGVAQAQTKAVDTRVLTATPTVTASPDYTAGDVVGGLLTFTNAFPATSRTGRIVSVAIVDDAGQTATYDLFLFKSEPATTYTDNAAFSPSEADLVLASPVLQVSSSNRFAADAKAITSLSSLNSFVQATSTTLYGVLVDRTGRNGASASDITVTLTIEVD